MEERLRLMHKLDQAEAALEEVKELERSMASAIVARDHSEVARLGERARVLEVQAAQEQQAEEKARAAELGVSVPFLHLLRSHDG